MKAYRNLLSILVLFCLWYINQIPTGECIVYPECEFDEDCGTGEFCVEGSCETQDEDFAVYDECEFDMDCGPGEFCVEGSCETQDEAFLIYDECECDMDCEPGEFCVEGSCVPETSSNLELVNAPDLLVDQLQVSQTVPGEQVVVTYRVRNTGDTDLEHPYSSRLYYRPPGADDSELVNLVEGFGAALSHDYPEGQMNLFHTQIPSTIEVGGTIEAWIDSIPSMPQGVIIELDESNNRAIYTITTLLPPLPDLTIPQVQLFQGDVLAEKLLAGHETRFEVVVRNEGLAESTAFPIAVYYQQADATNAEPILLVSVDSEGTLGSDQVVTFNLQALLPRSIQNGDSILIVADPTSPDSPTGLVQEEDEENNQIVIEVSVREPVEQTFPGQDPVDVKSTLQQMAEAYAELNRMNMAQYYGEENVDVSATAAVTGSDGIVRMEIYVQGEHKATQIIYYQKIDPSGRDQASNWQQVDFENKFT